MPWPEPVGDALPHGISAHVFALDLASGCGFNCRTAAGGDGAFALSPLSDELRRAFQRGREFGLSTVCLGPFGEFHGAMISASLHCGQAEFEAPRLSTELTAALQMASMKLAPEIRLLNLERLVKEMGTLDKVATAGGTSSVYLSQLRNGALDAKTGKVREMGSSMARRLEAGCHKSRGWMDVEHPELDQFDRSAVVLPPQNERENFPFSDHGRQRSGSFDELPPDQNQAQREVGKVNLAVMDVRASMGKGTQRPDHENIVMSMVVDETWLRRHANFSSPDNLGILTGIGDSMRPTFEDGDPLLVDRAVTDVKLDAIYVLSLNDELYIKRLQRRPDGTIVMISDNKSYEPYHITNAERDKFQVLGRVVMVWNARKF